MYMKHLKAALLIVLICAAAFALWAAFSANRNVAREGAGDAPDLTITEGASCQTQLDEAFSPKNVKFFLEGAEKGDPHAQFYMGAYNHLKLGNYKEAVKWFRKSAEQGCAEAQFRLAELYFQGAGAAANDQEGFKWLLKAAENGYPEALFKAAVYYEIGKGVEKNEAEAFKWFLKAAEQGDTAAQFKVGMCYESGSDGTAVNEKAAAEWYRRAAEHDGHELGVKEARYALGVCYRDGKGVAADKKEAAKWFKKAAEAGLEEAETALSELKQQ